MAVTFLTGFEGQAVDVDGITLTGTTSYSTATNRTGLAALRCNPASGAAGFLNIGASNNVWVMFALYVATMPSVARVIAGNATNINLLLNTDGTISARSSTTVNGTSVTALTTGVWYWIGYRCSNATAGNVLLQIDGIDAITASGTTTGLGVGDVGASGTEASAIDLYIDDIIRDGAAFLAPSKVDLALPISDNTRTAVTGGAGGTTNLWDAVNNTPPAGVASASETDTTNIEYPASLTEDYIANLETYTTLGVGASDTVLAVQSIVRHGEDIATGTKNLQNVGALTNPTVAGASVTAGANGGAHGAETGLWVTTFGTLTTSPSVTVGTSPTIRASRVSEARVGCIDFMGMVVAWTPAAAAISPAGYATARMMILKNRRILL